MNNQITKLAVATLFLLTALIVATTYWQTWAVAGLNDRQDNAIQRVAQFTIKRGNIVAADGTPLAVNRAKKVAGKTLYLRRYPKGHLFSHLVGYSTQSRSRSGLERSLNDYLTGSNTNLNTVLHTTLDKLKGSTIKGNNVVLTVSPKAQALALRLLGDRCGAVVVIEPKTGKVLVLASTPDFNPNAIDAPGGYARILRTRAQCAPASPLLNRAANGLFIPGSTFKTITASAALGSGKFTPESRFDDPGYCEEYGKQVRNAGNPEAPETFGNVDFTQAFEHSINSVFCNIGKALGAGRVLDQAKRFGFYQLPPLETPADERVPSGLYHKGRLFDPEKPQFQVDPGRLAFGQETMVVTPLQMAMVAAGIANGGIVMKPYSVDRIVAPGGGTVKRTRPEPLGRAVPASVAAKVNAMMQAAVTGGTGTAAQIPGIAVAGKTGTAETDVSRGINTTWFISFAPADDPKVAIAVVVANQQNGFGGTVAAPIAKEVMQAILEDKSK